ncbi:PaaI family thioesterase [Thermaurantiacus sp.]
MLPPFPPYAAMLGLDAVDDGLVMPFAPGLIGAPGRLHGGALAGLLEIAALRAVLDKLPPGAQVKPVSVTVDYLREGQMRDTFARAVILRQGRRIANVRAEAWQESPDRPITAARLNILIIAASTD